MLKIVAEKFKDVKVIETGSSAFKIAEAVNKSLTGRKHEFKLYPLSFKEMADDTSVLEESRMIDHRLICGYYPEVVTSPASFSAAYPDAHFECVTSTNLMGFLM